jgi:hypothetical protein
MIRFKPQMDGNVIQILAFARLPYRRGDASETGPLAR